MSDVRQLALEFFLLRDAEARIRARSAREQGALEDLASAADRRMRFLPGAGSVDAAVVSALLLRDALLLLLRASTWSMPFDASESFRRVCASEDAPSRWESLLPWLDEDGSKLDTLSLETLREIVARLDDTTRWLRRRLDVRSVENVLWARRGRLAALVIAGLALLFVGFQQLAAPNLALGRPVGMSSLVGGSAPPSALVDGVREARHSPATKGADIVQTNTEAFPSATIDLGEIHRIDSVRVFNREDTHFDDGLPYVLELSRDGATYDPVATRATHFGSGLLDPPWTVHLRDHMARYVRVRCSHYLALGEVEVFGR